MAHNPLMAGLRDPVADSLGAFNKLEQTQAADQQQQHRAMMAERMGQAVQSGNWDEFLAQHPDQIKTVQAITNYQDKVRGSNVGRVAGSVFSALQAGNKEAAKKIIQNNSQDFDMFGDEDINTAEALAMLEENPEQFQEMVGNAAILAGVPVDKLLGGAPEEMTPYQKEQLRLRELELGARNADREERTALQKSRAEEATKLKQGKEEQAKQKIQSAAQQTLSETGDTIGLIDNILNSKGFSAATGAKGASSLFGAFDTPIAGTEAADAAAQIETLQAKNFLTGIRNYKAAGGAGALSDAESKKLETSISSLNRDQSEEQFKKSLGVIKNILKRQQKVAQKNAGKQEQSYNNVTMVNPQTGERITYKDGKWQTIK